MKLKDTCSLEGKLWQTQCIKKQRHNFADKGLYSQKYDFSISHVWMWELNHKTEHWRIAAFKLGPVEDSWESLEQQRDQTSQSWKNQHWRFIGRTDAETEALILWVPVVKRQLIGKDSDAGQNWRQKEKRVAEDEMFSYYHQPSEHKFEQTLGDCRGQRSLVCIFHVS